MTDKLRVVIVGAGARGRTFAECYRMHEDVLVTTVVDTDGRRASDVAEEFALD